MRQPPGRAGLGGARQDSPAHPPRCSRSWAALPGGAARERASSACAQNKFVPKHTKGLMDSQQDSPRKGECQCARLRKGNEFSRPALQLTAKVRGVTAADRTVILGYLKEKSEGLFQWQSRDLVHFQAPSALGGRWVRGSGSPRISQCVLPTPHLRAVSSSGFIFQHIRSSPLQQITSVFDRELSGRKGRSYFFLVIGVWLLWEKGV